MEVIADASQCHRYCEKLWQLCNIFHRSACRIVRPFKFLGGNY